MSELGIRRLRMMVRSHPELELDAAVFGQLDGFGGTKDAPLENGLNCRHGLDHQSRPSDETAAQL
jgi:hypothetical protein